MRRSLLGSILLWALSATGAARAQDNQFGGGVHYWKTVKDVETDRFDRDGLAYVVSYQRSLVPMVRLGADLDIMPKNYGGSSNPAYAPQAYLRVGSGIYGALGIGINYIDNRFANSPFYLARAGLSFNLLPSFYVDLYANYNFERFEKVKDIDEDIDTDVVTLGAVARIEF